MLVPPLSLNVAKLFKGMSEEDFSVPVFGGGAETYDPKLTLIIFLGREYFSQGAIAVAFWGEKLHICIKTFLGWKPLVVAAFREETLHIGVGRCKPGTQKALRH